MLTEIEYSPLEAFRRLSHLPYITFLDSARFHPDHGRYSFLAADPRLLIRTEKDQTTVSAKRGRVTVGGDPWEVLDAMLSRFRLPSPVENLPTGAAIGFLSYDVGHWLDRIPIPRSSLLSTPELWFGFYDLLLAFDHLKKQAWLITQ